MPVAIRIRVGEVARGVGCGCGSGSGDGERMYVEGKEAGRGYHHHYCGDRSLAVVYQYGFRCMPIGFGGLIVGMSK